MKGYGILLMIVVGFLLLLPSLAVTREDDGQAVSAVTTEAEDRFLVQHTSETQQSEIDAYTLTLYTTASVIAADAPSEAIKAQAVACYTAYCYERNRDDGVILTSLPYPQAFLQSYWQEQWGEAYETNIAIYRAALDDVFGKQILYNDKPILAVYHELNTGKTEASTVLWEQELPYLQSVASPFDALHVDQLTTVTVAVDDATAIIATLCGQTPSEDRMTWFGEAVRSEAGTVMEMTVCSQTVDGRSIQQAFSLPSANFEVDVQGDELIFTVHGKGHGVGMSICGAKAMAENGSSYEDILAYYYTGVTVQ